MDRTLRVALNALKTQVKEVTGKRPTYKQLAGLLLVGPVRESILDAAEVRLTGQQKLFGARTQQKGGC